MISSRNVAQALFELVQQKETQLKDHHFSVVLPKVLRNFKRVVRETHEYEMLNIYTPHVVSEEEVQAIRTLVHADASTSVECHLDENLIGGFRATYRGKVYDATLLRKVQKLKQELTFKQ